MVSMPSAMDDGYIGGLGRIATTVKSSANTVKGVSKTGIIANSAFLKEFGYVDDVLFFKEYNIHGILPELYKVSLDLHREVY